MFTLRCRKADIVATMFYRLFRCGRLLNRLYHRINEKPEQGLTTGVNDTSNNVSPVTTTPVITYGWCRRISTRIFVQILYCPEGILRGPGETVHDKTLSRKSRVRLPLNQIYDFYVLYFRGG